MFDYMFHVPGPVAAVASVAGEPLWKLTVVDGRSGRPLRLGGEVFAVYTRRPECTRAELMAGRDPLIWLCRAERIDPVEGRV